MSVETFTMGPALLFCPADRPERFIKAAERAVAVILDLEDAVAPESKDQARRELVQSALDPERIIVRINPAGSDDAVLDLEALAETEYRTVMLAKAESGAQIRELIADASEALDGLRVIALCETALGVVNAVEIAKEPEVIALMWGAEDLIASLGGSSSRDHQGQYRSVASQARAQVLLAAGAYGKSAIDAVYLDIPDTEGLGREVADAVASGFTATACIHPSQVAVIRAGYAPDDAEVAEARALLQAAAEADSGVFQYQARWSTARCSGMLSGFCSGSELDKHLNFKTVNML